MSHKLYLFPPEANHEFHHDNGFNATSIPATHPTGRPGKVIVIPDSVPDKNGANIIVTQSKKNTIDLRGILFKDLPVPGEAMLAIDDYRLIDEKVCPEVPPVPPPPTSNNPIDIINAVYNTGKFNLSTKDGCGKFTEECCKQLHELHSNKWGHIQKFPPQNHYPEEPYVPGGKVHAVDAIQLLNNTSDTEAGVYDIIFNSEDPAAKPAFNFKGSPIDNLWYYPA